MLRSSFIALNSGVYLSNTYVTERISGTRNLNGHTSLYFLPSNVRLLAPNVASRLKLGSQKAFMFFLFVSSLCDNYAQADSTTKEEREQEEQKLNQLTLVLHWEHHKPSVLNQKQREYCQRPELTWSFSWKLIKGCQKEKWFKKNDYFVNHNIFVTLLILYLLPSFCLVVASTTNNILSQENKQFDSHKKEHFYRFKSSPPHTPLQAPFAENSHCWTCLLLPGMIPFTVRS